MVLIGDVHGKLKQYKEIVDRFPKTICVGDFGFQSQWDWHLSNIDCDSHRILMGNHDYYPYLYKKPSLGDYGLFNDIFVVRGAYSIDRVYRTEGIDWFSNEQLSYQHGLLCLDLYLKVKPAIVVTHDCPHSIRGLFFNIKEKSDTSNLLEAMLNEHQPDLWVFGHHHRHKDSVVNGTRFVCLEELQTLQI